MSWIELVAQRRSPTAPPGMQPPENAKEWFRIENSAEDADTTDIYVYDSIGGWFGMYADEFIEALGQVTSKNISLRLNSPGGSVFEGIAIANAIRNHPANVTVYVDSLAASIASVIALAGNRLVMMPHSQIMIHNASGACFGDATEMTKMADLLDKQSRNIAEAYAQHTGRPLAEWQQYMADETWFTAEEAVAVGLADEAMPMKPKKGEQAEEPACALADVMNRSWDLSMYNHAGREAAPAPVIPEKQTFATGGILTASALQEMSTVPGELIVKAGVSNDDILAAIREAVRQAVHDELAVIEGTACPSHSTAVKDGTWDAGANEGHLPSPVPVATVKKMYAYYDEDKVEDGNVPKSACKLPHHFVGADGSPGAASVAGVRNALARLPQTQGLSDAERSAAEAHLRKHLNAFNGGDEEDHVHEEPEGHEHTDVEDASPKAPPPDEDTPGTEPEPEQEPDEDDEPDKEAAKNSASDWDLLIAGLITPSPSADDVFNTLKEEW
jgi:ATP-dependent Clp endopeptidase proteolytic subunit ClpP